MTDERDDEHVRQISNALREELDAHHDPAALARLAGAALGDGEAEPEPTPDEPPDEPPDEAKDYSGIA